MPTVFPHPAPVLALTMALGSRAVPARLLLFGVLCALLPDADVVGFRLGIPYADILGHRGFFHSLAFALGMGLVGAGLAPVLRCGRMAALGGFFAVASHILLDAMTSGGLRGRLLACGTGPGVLPLASHQGIASWAARFSLSAGRECSAVRTALGLAALHRGGHGRLDGRPRRGTRPAGVAWIPTWAGRRKTGAALKIFLMPLPRTAVKIRKEETANTHYCVP